MKRAVAHASPSVALVGRKNVGKSSLFNRLIEKRQAIVSDVPGTTRDVGVGYSRWRGRSLTLLDTGGLDVLKSDELEMNVRKQALRAAAKAHLIVFVGEARAGPTETDVALARELRKLGKPVVLAVNKADSPAVRAAIDPGWKKLGFGEPLPVSAVNGTGTGDLLDAIFEKLSGTELPLENVEPELILTMVGRPNVGKSSLLNALLGEERVIVSEIPHTTREPQDTLIFFDGRPILVVDTAGIRKRARIDEGLETTGVAKSLAALKKTDVALLVLDVTDEVGVQDRHLAGLVEESGKGLVIVLNKWDLATDKTPHTAERVKDYFRVSLPFLAWAPMILTSAATGQRVEAVIDTALRVRENRSRRLTEDELDDFFQRFIKPYLKETVPHRKSALGVRHKTVKAYGIRQTAVEPPAFSLVVRDKATVSVNFLRYVENLLRQKFDFEGAPIHIHAREIER